MLGYTKPEQKHESESTIQKKETEKPDASPNLTGIPDAMKTHFEKLSGFSFDDVRVHYNSDKPAQLQALAYTRDNQVYIAPGQETTLRHELGHVVQQKRGHIKGDTAVNGLMINTDAALENEADAFYSKPYGVGTKEVAYRYEGVVQRGQTAEEILATLPESEDKTAMEDIVENKIGTPIGPPKLFGLVTVLIGVHAGLPSKMVAEYHVASKGDKASTLLKDIYSALLYSYNYQDDAVCLFWMNPNGAQVVKGIVELLGESVGEHEYRERAKELRSARKRHKQTPTAETGIDKTVVPEHELYLRSLYKTPHSLVIRSRVEKSVLFKNMLEDKAAFEAHIQALRDLKDVAAGLNISFDRGVANKMIEVLKKRMPDVVEMESMDTIV